VEAYLRNISRALVLRYGRNQGGETGLLDLLGLHYTMQFTVIFKRRNELLALSCASATMKDAEFAKLGSKKISLPAG
jgi:hypothetical protein